MTTTYTSATDKAKAIRKELKTRFGVTGRDVSVRSEYFSLGSAIRVEIKNPHIASFNEIKDIAEGYERVRRCEVTGEILGGGNCYVSVNYSSDALDQLAAPYVERVEKALEELRSFDRNSSTHVDVTERTSISRSGNGWGVSTWTDGRHGQECSDNALCIARTIAVCEQTPVAETLESFLILKLNQVG